MVVNYLIRPGVKINIELSFLDARLIKACGHCKVNGYRILYRMGKHRIASQVEDNGRMGKELIEWFLN